MVKYNKFCLKGKKKNKSLSFFTHRKRKLRKDYCPIKYVSPLEFDKNTYFYYEITKIIKSPRIIEQYYFLKITKEDLDVFKDEISIYKKKQI